MNRWTVHVEQFGKIKKADIEVAPFTMLIGDNNSGKSYLMTLIYGLFSSHFFYDKYSFNVNSESFRRCITIIDEMLEDTFFEKREFDNDDIMAFQNVLNTLLHDNIDKFLMDLFNRKMNIGNLWIEFNLDNNYKFWFEEIEDAKHKEQLIIYAESVVSSEVLGYSFPVEEKGSDEMYCYFISYFLENMLKSDFIDMENKEITYFPTARTGFLLTYKSLVSSAMQSKYNIQNTEKNLLTKPTSDFLTRLSEMTQAKPRYTFDSIIRLIENTLIDGKISISDLPTQDIAYTPMGDSTPIPMFVTSGVVTELTPLILFLRYTQMNMLLMEEPEISLHPRLQWAMAKVLIRLCNEGVPVFITTHSDIILQHINNMIRAGKCGHNDAFLEKYNYTQYDLISEEKIRVYQLEVDEQTDKTTVTQLKCGDYGYEAMTFYTTLNTMNKEITELDNMGE